MSDVDINTLKKIYKREYYQNNKEKISGYIKKYKEKNKLQYDIYNTLLRLNKKKARVLQSTLDKYQIYFDKDENIYKSKLSIKKIVENEIKS